MAADLVTDLCARIDAKAKAWEEDVKRMRELTTVNPPADTLACAAKELRELAHQLRHQVVEVGPEVYGRALGVSSQTVRTWCARGEIPGARQDAAGRWRIPRDAKRVRRAQQERQQERRRA